MTREYVYMEIINSFDDVDTYSANLYAEQNETPVIKVFDTCGHKLGYISHLSFDAHTGKIKAAALNLTPLTMGTELPPERVVTLPWNCFIQDQTADKLLVNTGLVDIFDNQQAVVLH